MNIKKNAVLALKRVAKTSLSWTCCMFLIIGSTSGYARPEKSSTVSKFLHSIGVSTSFPGRGQPLTKTIEMINFCGFRWVRAGIEDLHAGGVHGIEDFIDLHQKTGVLFSWGLGSGGADVDHLLDTGKILANSNALLAFEGNNEPNNWGVSYLGEKGGGQHNSWIAVARLQRDLYRRVKSDPKLKNYPVWTISEAGAQKDNVGLQFLEIPKGSNTLMPDGTRFADFANLHNYIYHPNSPQIADNKVWDAAEYSSKSKVDGLYGNFGLTWAQKFEGYDEKQLATLPRVTTETGVQITDKIDENLQGLNLLNMYLAQFKRGYTYTAAYILRDRTDEAGNQSFGFFRPDYTPRKSAYYISNLTKILSDKGADFELNELDYDILDQPSTVHDLLLQKSDGSYFLIVWSERALGNDDVTVKFNKGPFQISVYNPLVGDFPIKRVSENDRLSISMKGSPLLIHVVPLNFR